MPTGTRPAPLAGTARVAISGTVYGHKWVNVFWLTLTSSGTVTVNDLQTLADAIATLWGTNVSPKQHIGVTMSAVQIVFFPTSSTELVFTGSYTHAGTASTGINDAGASACINWTISAFYRGGHPRTYMAGPDASHVTNGSDLDTTYVSGLATAFNAVRNGINALTSTNVSAVVMGTASYIRSGAWRGAPVFFAYTSVHVRNKLASQRRRILS